MSLGSLYELRRHARRAHAVDSESWSRDAIVARQLWPDGYGSFIASSNLANFSEGRSSG